MSSSRKLREVRIIVLRTMRDAVALKNQDDVFWFLVGAKMVCPFADFEPTELTRSQSMKFLCLITTLSVSFANPAAANPNKVDPSKSATSRSNSTKFSLTYKGLECGLTREESENICRTVGMTFDSTMPTDIEKDSKGNVYEVAYPLTSSQAMSIADCPISSAKLRFMTDGTNQLRLSSILLRCNDHCADQVYSALVVRFGSPEKTFASTSQDHKVPYWQDQWIRPDSRLYLERYGRRNEETEDNTVIRFFTDRFEAAKTKLHSRDL